MDLRRGEHPEILTGIGGGAWKKWLSAYAQAGPKSKPQTFVHIVAKYCPIWNFFTRTFYGKFVIQRLPPHLNCIATLLCEKLILKNHYNHNKYVCVFQNTCAMVLCFTFSLLLGNKWLQWMLAALVSYASAKSWGFRNLKQITIKVSFGAGKTCCISWCTALD